MYPQIDILPIMKFRAVLLVVLLVISLSPVYSQRNYIFQHYTNENGLPANGVKGIERKKLQFIRHYQSRHLSTFFFDKCHLQYLLNSGDLRMYECVIQRFLILLQLIMFLS